jgi:predicted nucleic acid-binding Zn ribbon protein
MVKQGTCNVCGCSFTYEHEGRGRLRRYCDLHKCVPKGDSCRHHVCLRCGDEFDGAHNAKYCRSCKPVIDAEYARKSREKIRLNGIEIVVPDKKKCGHCGKIKPTSAFSPQRNRPNGLTSWCKECRRLENRRKRDAQPKKPKQPRKRMPNGLHCSVCGTELVGSQRIICSDRECILEYTRRRSYQHDSAKKVMRPRKCKWCGEQFTPEYGNKRRMFCSDECLKKFSRRKRATGTLNQRARKIIRKVYGGLLPTLYEPIKAKTVLDRDQWVCGICGQPIDKGKKCPDDGSPSVDHIVPLSQGGAHLYSNVQAAHFKCNWMKGDGVHV